MKAVGEEQMSATKWQAIIQNDAASDGQFIYAVATTGIFCRPSCKSREPKMENVRIFQNPAFALSAGFRPCKRCKPTGERLPDADWVEQITRYIETNYSEAFTLEALSEMCHGSPYHLHRIFKRVTGMTPVAYIQQTRIMRAKEQLVHSTHAVAEIGFSVGLPNTPYFITLFKKHTGQTPNEFRKSSRAHLDSEGSINGRRK